MGMIDAEALYKEIADCKNACDEVMRIIKRQYVFPDPAREHGKWTDGYSTDEDSPKHWQIARCSVCGRTHAAPYNWLFTEYAYCPNCGAYMRGEP